MSNVSVPRPSATVVLARGAALEPEIFMVRRHEKTVFGAVHAFPGGVLDADDTEVFDYCRGLDEIDADHRLGIDHNGLAYYSAAIRELFEETGVLLGDIASLDEDLEALRAALNDGSLRWQDFVRQNELPLFCDRLHYISHWITPRDMEKRFSTRFFLAELPDGQEPVHCGIELTDSCWATANELLAASRRGDIDLYFPTTKTLESVARHKSLKALTEWAAAKVDWGITTMLPIRIERNGKRDVVLPGDKDYPGAKR